MADAKEAEGSGRVIEAAEFRMTELVTRRDLASHPVWADFHGDPDRERILSWGVTPSQLESELDRYGYCGRSPLYPVIDLNCARDLPSVTVELEVALPSGVTAAGYWIRGGVLGVYLNGDEYCFNASLPARMRAEAWRLGRAIGCTGEDLAVIRYESSVALGPEGRIHGAFELA